MDNYNALGTAHSKLAWTNNLVTSFSRSDYVSLSEADALAPRRGDGSMPSRFGRLLPGSNLIDAGGVVPSSITPNLAQLEADYPFLQKPIYGVAPDLGPYELYQEDSLPSGVQQIVAPESNGRVQVLSGNNAWERIIKFSVPADATAEMVIYDLNGQMVQRVSLTHLTSGVDYYQPVSVSSMNGMYVVRIAAGGFSASEKFVVK